MPELTLTAKYRKNTGIVLSAMEMDTLYFYGSIFYSKDGTAYSNENKRTYILAAQDEIEKYLNIKFKRQLIEETIPFLKQDYWQTFPILKTNFPVSTPLAMVGLLNSISQIIYPKEWLKSSFSSEGYQNKRISVVPNGATTANTSGDVILTGMMSQIGMQRMSNIPDYWTVQYVSGFSYKNIPTDLINVVGKYGSLGVFSVMGDIVLGSGIANMSLSVDGLSQSIGTTSSATSAAFSARIIQYQKDIKESLVRLKNIYKGINFTVL